MSLLQKDYIIILTFYNTPIDIFVSRQDIYYYDRMENPVEIMLKYVSDKRRLTVGDLYDMLFKCDASALAFKHLSSEYM
jgi:hypothetical protein